MNNNPKDPASWEKTSSQFGYYKLPKKEVWGYSSIDFAMNLVFQCIALYTFTPISLGCSPAMSPLFLRYPVSGTQSTTR